uniref:Coiled-coil domain containing 152 n=1 Tax=Astyanax mexicanus TaxID=7994 RepID=A0A3B1IVG3_ASTMX
MKKTSVNLDKLVQDFSLLEQKITELKGKNNIFEIKLDEINRLLKFSQNKEKHLTEERDGLMESIQSLQQNLQQQCDLRVENDNLKSAVVDMKKQIEAQVQERKACVQRLEAEMKALQEKHQKMMDDCANETQRRLESKDVELKEALERKESALEEMRRNMKVQEKEGKSEIIKLQMEFSAKLAKAQRALATNQQQPQGSGILPQNIFKRKLQFLQEEKNKEIEALRQRVKELEQQNLHSLSESRLKRRKI